MWTNARDDPDFSPYKYLLAVPVLFILLFGSLSIGIRDPQVSLESLLSAYAALCIFVGVFVLHSKIFIGREFLIVWKNKVFVQIPGFNSGWRIIPRDKFKVDVFRYNSRKDLDTLADPPEIILDQPYKGKVYFLFSDSLVKPKISGVIRRLVSERDMRELIDILKPRKVMRTVFAPVGGYAYAKTNLGSKLRELIDKMLNTDILSIAQSIYEDVYKAARAAISVDDTLLALSLFKREKESALLMEYCITGRIARYMRRLTVLKIGDMWHPNTGKFGGYLMGNILWIIGLSPFLIILFSLPYGPGVVTAAFILLISVGIAAMKTYFIDYNGVMGDTRLRFYFGLFMGLAIDTLLGVLHMILPFIAVMITGPAAALPTLILYAYLVYSVVFMVHNILYNIFRTGYFEYRKLAKEWRKFLKEEERGKTEMKYEEVSV